MYIVVGSDGADYGPVDFLGLTEWVAQGRVTAGTVVRDAETGRETLAGDMLTLYSAFHPDEDHAAPPRQSAPARPEAPARQLRSPLLAVLLSLWVPGLGQIYNRQVTKALAILAVTVLLALKGDWRVSLLLLPIGAIDAGLVAARLNRGEHVGDWQWF